MAAQGLTGATRECVQGAIERRINERTFGRIHRLAVEAAPGRVAVRGYAPSYYVKQLAIQAVLDVLGSDQFPEVLLEIEVGPCQPTANERRGQGLARNTNEAE